jgi:hypothetical protein
LSTSIDCDISELQIGQSVKPLPPNVERFIPTTQCCNLTNKGSDLPQETQRLVRGLVYEAVEPACGNTLSLLCLFLAPYPLWIIVFSD